MGVLLGFVGVAAIVTITPGPATALVIRTALVGGRGRAVAAIAGNSLGVLSWAILSAAGVAAVVAASRPAFDALKLAGAVVLVLLGVDSLVRGRRQVDDAASRARGAFRAGILTSLANPKLAVFFVALFPQFIPHGAPVAVVTVAMGCLIVSFDLIWFSLLAAISARAGHAVADRARPWLERVSGVTLIGVGARVALESR